LPTTVEFKSFLDRIPLFLCP